MKGINLLKYHDKSFSDLHRLMSGEIEDEAFTELVLSPVQGRPAKKTRLINPVYAAALLLALAAAAIAYMYFSSRNRAASTELPPAAAEERTEVTAQPSTRLEREGYMRIGGLAFVDDNTSAEAVTLVSEYDPAADALLDEENEAETAVEIKSLDVSAEPEPRMVVIPRGTYVAAGRSAGTPTPPAARQTEAPSYIPEEVQARRAEEARQAAAQPRPAPAPAPAPARPAAAAVIPAAIPGKIYRIEFENLSSAKRYSILTNVERAGLKSEQELVSTSETYLWRVYRLVPGAAMQLEGRGVEFAADLPSQEEALEYVRKNGIPAAIKQVKIENSVYNVTVCCMEQDKARSFAQSNGRDGTRYSLKPVADKSN